MGQIAAPAESISAMNAVSFTPLLSITIPTYNRAAYLAMNLQQLGKESQGLMDRVEFIVCDNDSQDGTAEVVRQAIELGLPIHYQRNTHNIGGDANFAQCFNLARGKYVLLLGDDDVLVDGALKSLLETLAHSDAGVVCLRPYGYANDFRREYPGSSRWQLRSFSDASSFLTAIGPLVTLISACVINKSALPGLDANAFCGGNLIHVHLVIRAALARQTNLYVHQYQVACKRNNSGGYDFSDVFVTNLCGILDSYVKLGLLKSAIRAIERRMLLAFYPYYVLRMRVANNVNLLHARANFEARFGNRWIYWIWLAPGIGLPRPLALVWGGLTTLLGRAWGGDLQRGMAFTWNRMFGPG
jgi:glycosyltransferase involved in cell wall biosynthesis